MYIALAIAVCLPLVSPGAARSGDPAPAPAPDEDIQFRVVNGRPATLGQIPYQVSLKGRVKRYSYVNFCGGSLVGRSKILSAAHCFVTDGNVCERACGKQKMKNLKKIYAVAGTLRTIGYYQEDSQGTEQWRNIINVLIPDGYTFPKRDIALAFTATKFVINNHVKALPMAQVTMDYGWKECLASGYGRISQRITSDSLLYAQLQLIPTSQCSLIHGKDMRSFICTSSAVSDVLQGDSGGPLVCKDTKDPNDRGEGVIVGVVSGARQAARGGRWETFFTRVSSYRGFYLRDAAPRPRAAAAPAQLLLAFTIISDSIS